MKKYSLLIILCSLFIYANTFAQQDAQFEFEFELVLDKDDGSESDDDDGDDDNDGSESDDDDGDDDGNGKSGKHNGEKNNNDDVNSSLRADLVLTNTGVPSLTEDITFRVHVGTTVPETLPTEYDTESTLVFDIPLSASETKNFSISIPDGAIQVGIDNIVTIWPLAKDEDNFGGEKSNSTHYVYEMIFIPTSDNPNKVELLPTASEVNIYPNPTNGILQIEIPDNQNATNQITIYNIAGQSIKTIKSTSDLTTLDLQLMSGIYFVAIRNESGQIIHYSKLIFHR